jgi:hypothetical protein
MVTLDVLTSAPLTVEMLVARDISAYTERLQARQRASMDAQASTRPSPASLRKNGMRDLAARRAPHPQ